MTSWWHHRWAPPVSETLRPWRCLLLFETLCPGFVLALWSWGHRETAQPSPKAVPACTWRCGLMSRVCSLPSCTQLLHPTTILSHGSSSHPPWEPTLLNTLLKWSLDARSISGTKYLSFRMRKHSPLLTKAILPFFFHKADKAFDLPQALTGSKRRFSSCQCCLWKIFNDVSRLIHLVMKSK